MKKPRKSAPRELQTKRALDQRVAELLGEKLGDVAAITEAFLLEVEHALVDGDEVRLDGLGILHVACSETKGKLTVLTDAQTHDKGVVAIHRKYYVRFRKSTRLREAIWARHGRLKRRRTSDGEVRRRRKRGR